MPPKFLDPKTMARLRATAHASGGAMRENPHPPRPGHLPVAWNDMQWDVAGNCLNPKNVVYRSRPYGKGPHHMTQFMEMNVKCRQCANCLKQKAAHWRLRALAEYGAAPRTWLWTLTLSPAEQMQALHRARRHLDAQGVDFDKLDESEQFDLRHRETGRVCTLALKRLRKGGEGIPGVSFRYLLIAEAHRSGLPHYHALIHEIGGSHPIPHRALKRAWIGGFCDAKRVADERQAVYACKYLTKSHVARVRASVGYGNSPSLTVATP